MKTLRILSLGAGVQSTALALMIEKRQLPMVNSAIFADTGGEPDEVYRHLEWLKKQLSYPVHVVKWGNLKKDIMRASTEKNHYFPAIPFFSLNQKTGNRGMLRRQCTYQYKIFPVEQKVREIMGYKKGERVDKKKWKVELLIGISTDEMQRAKENKLKYVNNTYPLIEQGMTRGQCIEWYEKNKYPTPPRSSCTFCPYNSNKRWKQLKQDKELWEELVDMDNHVRGINLMNTRSDNTDPVFLHSDRVPLTEIDFDKEDDQLSFSFDDECEGMCGV